MSKKVHSTYDEHHVLHELRHYLPSQTPLKDFIHHNSLHAFQDMKFYDGIFKASKMFGYQVTLQLSEFRKLYEIGRIKDEVLIKAIVDRKGLKELGIWRPYLLTKNYEESTEPRIGALRAYWKNHYHIDLDTSVQPLLFRILSSYLDQGIALWDFPIGNKGFLESMRDLETQSFSSFLRVRGLKNCFLKAISQ